MPSTRSPSRISYLFSSGTSRTVSSGCSMPTSNFLRTGGVPPSVAQVEGLRGARPHGLLGRLDVVVAEFGPQDGDDPVVAHLEEVGGEHLARPRTDAAVPVHGDPGHRPPPNWAGSRLMPLTNDDRSRFGSP